jgi:hypothetical protein
MSIKNVDAVVKMTDYPSQWEEFCGIKEFGFSEWGGLVVSMYTTPFVKESDPRGIFFTCLPISSKEYRLKIPTRTHYVRASATLLTVYDDWGKAYTFEAPQDILDTIEGECLKNNILDHNPDF